MVYMYLRINEEINISQVNQKSDFFFFFFRNLRNPSIRDIYVSQRLTSLFLHNFISCTKEVSQCEASSFLITDSTEIKLVSREMHRGFI